MTFPPNKNLTSLDQRLVGRRLGPLGGVLRRELARNRPGMLSD
jgi:hypothetical protein